MAQTRVQRSSICSRGLFCSTSSRTLLCFVAVAEVLLDYRELRKVALDNNLEIMEIMNGFEPISDEILELGFENYLMKINLSYLTKI